MQELESFEWLYEKWADIVVLDTETTGLEDSDQIIELAIINLDNEALFNQRFKPSIRISDAASSVHCISESALENCSGWSEYHEQIEKILDNKIAIIFNKEFDIRLLKQTAIAFQCSTQFLSDLEKNTYCAMAAAASEFGATNRHGGISLINACAAAGLDWFGQAHTALADCEMTRRLIIAIAERVTARHKNGDNL